MTATKTIDLLAALKHTQADLKNLRAALLTHGVIYAAINTIISRNDAALRAMEASNGQS